MTPVRVLLLLCALLAGAAAGAPVRTVTAELRGERFVVEVADTPEARLRGLMGRTRIDPRGGMLLAYSDDRPRWFWMKNCLVDIDVAFLDAGGRVVAVHAMAREAPRAPGETEEAYEARLKVYGSGSPARFALELAGGTAARLGARPGDRVVLGPMP